jgi:hypothetical protein
LLSSKCSDDKLLPPAPRIDLGMGSSDDDVKKLDEFLTEGCPNAVVTRLRPRTPASIRWDEGTIEFNEAFDDVDSRGIEEALEAPAKAIDYHGLKHHVGRAVVYGQSRETI